MSDAKVRDNLKVAPALLSNMVYRIIIVQLGMGGNEGGLCVTEIKPA